MKSAIVRKMQIRPMSPTVRDHCGGSGKWMGTLSIRGALLKYCITGKQIRPHQTLMSGEGESIGSVLGLEVGLSSKFKVLHDDLIFLFIRQIGATVGVGLRLTRDRCHLIPCYVDQAASIRCVVR